MIKNWIDLPLKEKIRLNNEMGFTVDNVFPPGTGIRERFDKMCEDTMIDVRKMHEGKFKIPNKNLMDLSPDQILKEVKDGNKNR